MKESWIWRQQQKAADMSDEKRQPTPAFSRADDVVVHRFVQGGEYRVYENNIDRDGDPVGQMSGNGQTHRRAEPQQYADEQADRRPGKCAGEVL